MTKEAVTAAAIDLGSNTFRMLIGRATGTDFTPLERRQVSVRLGQELGRKKALVPAAMERGIRALTGFSALLGEYRPDRIRACGTHALRRAANRADFLDRAKAVLGVEVEVLSGEAEARLTLLGAARAMKEAPGAPFVLVDIGGGSTEIIEAAAGAAGELRVVSLPLGAVGLTEDFMRAPHAAADLDAVRRFVTARLAEHLEGRPVQGRIFACGGTATALAALDLGLRSYEAAKVQGHRLERAGLNALCARLAALEVTARNRLPGLEEGRGEIILAGALVCRTLLDFFGAQALIVSDAGLLEGILLSCLE